MTRTIFASLLLAMASYSAHAAVAWQGEVVIDTATAACTNVAGIKVDTVIKSVLQPKNISGNTANTIVTFNYNANIMFAMVLDHGALDGTAAGFGYTYSGVLKTNVGVIYSQFVQAPVTVVAATPDVTLKGRIEDFMLIPNCDVTFRAAYTKNNG
jgi:hypothetical protein